MHRVPRVARLRVQARATDARGFCRGRDPAWAQAWVAPAGLGSVTVAVQTINNTGHTDADGVFTQIGRSVNTRIDIEADYAFTDRLSLSAGLPFVFAKYVDPLPYGPPGLAVSDVPAGMIPFPPRDQCRCWQSGWQDFGFTARYNLINGAFALTPSVSFGVPSHDYEFRGEAVVGQRLKEMRVSVDAGQRLDAISPNLYIQGRYSYAFVERVLDDVPNNRSNATVEGGFLITRRLAVRGLLLWQRVHGGLSFGGSSGFHSRGKSTRRSACSSTIASCATTTGGWAPASRTRCGRWTCSLLMSNSCTGPTRMPVGRSPPASVGRSN